MRTCSSASGLLEHPCLFKVKKFCVQCEWFLVVRHPSRTFKGSRTAKFLGVNERLQRIAAHATCGLKAGWEAVTCTGDNTDEGLTSGIMQAWSTLTSSLIIDSVRRS